MSEFKLGPSTSLGSVAIRVKDRDKMIDFYQKVVGFDLKLEENELAILGTEEPHSELLLLEESPRAAAHTGEIKKLRRLTLVIPTEEELADVLCRVRKAGYPIKDALERKGHIGILLVDPEGNELEIYHGKSNEPETSEPEELDQSQLLRKAEEQHAKLTAGTHFAKVHLNVRDLAQEQTFLSDILGLDVKDEHRGIHVLNEGTFHVGLDEAEGGTIDLPTDEVLGLDFLRFIVDEASLLSLEEHLATSSYDFFIDKKKSVLTIYDAVGIEWWFMRK